MYLVNLATLVRMMADPQMIVQAINAAMGGLKVADMPTPVKMEEWEREGGRACGCSACRVWVEWQQAGGFGVIGPSCRVRGRGCRVLWDWDE